jgi:hypothetical protein
MKKTNEFKPTPRVIKEDPIAHFPQKGASIFGGEQGIQYRENVLSERDKLINALNEFKGNAKNIDFLKGDIAEYYHAGTYNINAAQKGSVVRAEVPRSTEFGSPDIIINGKGYQLKYYKNGKATARAQATSFEQAAKNPNTAAGAEKLLDVGQAAPGDPVYGGQTRIVPEDQLDDAKEALEKMIAKENAARPEQAERYQDTLDNITDRIEENGNTSTPLSEPQAKDIAAKAKDGEVTPENIGVTDADVIKMDYVIRNAAKAGLVAAGVSAGISLVVNLVQKYRLEHKTISDYTEEDWKELFGSTLFQAGAAGISATALSVVGSYSKCAVPGVSALLMATFGVASLVPDYVEHKITKEEFIIGAEMACLDAAITLLGSVVGQMVIPVPALGGILGALAASIAWSIVKELWGDELEELLTAINESIEKMLNAVKEFFEEIWEKIIAFFKDIAEHVNLLLDEDFNYNLRHTYKKYVKDTEYRMNSQKIRAVKEQSYKMEVVYEAD